MPEELCARDDAVDVSTHRSRNSQYALAWHFVAPGFQLSPALLCQLLLQAWHGWQFGEISVSCFLPDPSHLMLVVG